MPEPEQMDPTVEQGNVPEFARKVVFDYVSDNLEKTELHIRFRLEDVYVIWFGYILGNWRAVIQTNLPNGQLYEVVMDRARGEIYINTYVKIPNDALPITIV
jgi:hypothetical protein